MTVEVRAADEADFAALVARAANAQEQYLEAERFEAQQRGEGLLLLAWDGDAIRGRVRLRWWSKYVEVVDALGEFPEINALDAWPQGQGVGTQIIKRCEEIAAERGDAYVGIAVVTTNVDARRLYARLGYEFWGDVTDEWTAPDGTVHRDPAVYLLKKIT